MLTKITIVIVLFFVTAIRVDFRQSFRGSISITVLYIETQHTPNESSRKDLQIIVWPLLRQVAPSWHNLRQNVSTCVKVFLSYSVFLLSFFLKATFRSTIALP